MYYTVCPTTADCFLTEDEAQGLDTNAAPEIGTLQEDGSTTIATISHSPSVCSDQRDCYYMFSVAVEDTSSFILVALVANHTATSSESISLELEYVNVLNQENYQYYELNPADNEDMRYLVSLTIDLFSYQGDGDLFVSTTQKYPSIEDYEYSSRYLGIFDRIIMNATADLNYLNYPIYISVFACTRVSFYLDMQPVFAA
mmetsp:Transcript_22972/g.22314  ORF Transcript_22972/g.22314 Transcript_22972/m.22314 type:complete len:200 (+) Transcript_22972:1348-1947(+)